jgi:hypothetical protein
VGRSPADTRQKTIESIDRSIKDAELRCEIYTKDAVEIENRDAGKSPAVSQVGADVFIEMSGRSRDGLIMALVDGELSFLFPTVAGCSFDRRGKKKTSGAPMQQEARRKCVRVTK